MFGLQQKMQRRRKRKKTRKSMFWFTGDRCEVRFQLVQAQQWWLATVYWLCDSLNRRVRVRWAPRLCVWLNYSVRSGMRALVNRVSYIAYRYYCSWVCTNGPRHDWISVQACLVACKWTLLVGFLWWFAISRLNILPQRTVGNCLLYSYTFVEFYVFSSAFPHL